MQSADGLVVRFTDNNVSSTASGIWFLAVSVGSAQGPDGINIPLAPLGGIGGRLYLGPVLFSVLGSGALGTTADTEVILAPAGSIPTSAIGNIIHLQGLTSVKGAGDNLTFVWNFWWMRQTLAAGSSFFHTDAIFWPFGTSLLLHTHTALEALTGATLLSRLSLVGAQNVTILASMAANGFFTYLLAYHLTRSRTGALAAGALFACAPYFEACLIARTACSKTVAVSDDALGSR